jgi:endonuclease/exonuclease/phosphatase family metal-dependent hydrolase
VRVGTFNILHGRSITDGLVEPQRLRHAIGSLDVDVLGMQEVDRNQPRSAWVDQTALAADALGAADYRFAAAVFGTPGETFRAATATSDSGAGAGAGAASAGLHIAGPEGAGSAGAEREFGVALISRFPVHRWLVYRLAPAPVRSPVAVGRRVLLLPDEPRVVLAAVLETPAGPLTVATTHLSFVPGWNVWQLRRTVHALRSLPGPRVLLGDLNLPASVAGLVSGWPVAVRRPTYPAPAPRVQLDYVLVDPTFGATVVGARTPSTPVSDHRPLVVQLSSR